MFKTEIKAFPKHTLDLLGGGVKKQQYMDVMATFHVRKACGHKLKESRKHEDERDLCQSLYCSG